MRFFPYNWICISKFFRNAAGVFCRAFRLRGRLLVPEDDSSGRALGKTVTLCMKTTRKESNWARVGNEANEPLSLDETKGSVLGIETKKSRAAAKFVALAQICVFLSATTASAERQWVELFEANIQTDNRDFLWLFSDGCWV